MPQVPYTPYPTASPTGGGESISVNTPAAAFGENIGAAVEKLGGSIEQASGEVYNRAIALQQLNNETDARNAEIDFTMKTAPIHAQFNSLQGQARANAMPGYLQSLQNLRTSTRQSLGSPESQRMFDAEAASVLNRSILSSAISSGEGLRQAAMTSENARYDLDTKQVYTDPSSEAGFEDALRRTQTSAGKKAALMDGGWSPEREDLISKQGQSTLAFNRIIGMARTDPQKAAQLYDNYSKRGLLFGREAEQAQAKVQSFSHTVGMDKLAQDIMAVHREPGGDFNKSFVDMQQEAEDQARKLYPNDPEIGTHAASALDRQYNQLRFAQRQDEQQVKQQVDTEIMKGVTGIDGLSPDLVKMMTPAQIKAYPGQAAGYRQSVDRITNQAQYDRLLGVYNNDVETFMNTDFYKEPGLSKANINFFLGLQRNQDARNDPRVGKAMQLIKGANPGVLQELGVYSRDRNNPDDFDRFTGTLHDALQAYQDNHGKPANEQQIMKEILPAVTARTTVKGRIFNSQEPIFSQPVTEEMRQAAETSAGHALDDEAVRRAVNLRQFQTLFSKPAAAQ